MKFDPLNDSKALVILAGLGVAVYLGWKLYKAAPSVAAAAASVGNAINPASDTNIVNRGVSAAGSAITGDSSWSLGGAIYEWFNKDPNAQANAALAASNAASDSQVAWAYPVTLNDNSLGLGSGPSFSDYINP